jgi:replicative DNA helicase
MESLSVSLQENLLALLCFDDEYAPLIRNAVEVSLFESAPYRDIAKAAVDFIDRFKHPAKEHIADLLEDKINGPDRRRGDLYANILTNLYGLRQSLNKEFVINQLTSFVRQQKLKQGIVKAARTLQTGAPDALEIAEREVLSSIDKSLELFNPGMFFGSIKSFNFLKSRDLSFPTGIKELDMRNLGPARKELHVFMAPPKRGKTWWLVNLAKHSLMDRKKVLHISLEMSEEKMIGRYVQSMFAIAKRPGHQSAPFFEVDGENKFSNMHFKDILDRPCLTDRSIETLLRRNVEKMGVRLKLVVKEFPTGTLTTNMLKAYLDALDHRYNFTPDLLLLDYLDLMDVPNSDHRLALGKYAKDLRGIAVERNIAVVTPSQTNREGGRASLINEGHVGEDYSKIATADLVLTYNQTMPEKQIGLARLFVANARNDEDKFIVILSQNYSIGQFCMDSAPMPPNYWKYININTNGNGDQPESETPEASSEVVH